MKFISFEKMPKSLVLSRFWQKERNASIVSILAFQYGPDDRIRTCGILGYAAGLRCPISSLPTERLRQLSTAAHKPLCCICHRQRRVVWPKAGTLLCSQDATYASAQHKNAKRTAPWGSSLYVVQVARLELAASCSQSRRATNCATPGYTQQAYYT